MEVKPNPFFCSIHFILEKNWGRDIQHNDTQYNDTQYNGTQYNDT